MLLSEDDLKLQHINCKKQGIESICIFSPDSECCKHIPRETIEFEYGRLIKHGNSAILSIKLEFNDEVERFIFERIRMELVRTPSDLIKPLRQPEEGYDLSLFFDENMTKSFEQRQQIIRFVQTLPEHMRQICTNGKMVINNYIRKQSSNFRL